MKSLASNASLRSLIVLVVLYLGLGLHFRGMLEPRVFINIIADNAFLGVVAIGVTFVILTGGIDLSVGSLVGLSGIFVAWLVAKHGWHPASALAASILLCTTFGAIQGALVAFFDIAPFLITLGGLFFARGAALLISERSIDISHPWFQKVALFSVPLIGGQFTAGSLVFLATVLCAIVVLRYTTYGRTVYAIGGNSQSARLMGLKVERSLIVTYAISGLCAGLGGALYSLYTMSGNAIATTGLELDAIAAVVIGGALLSGGYGTVSGTLVGVIILGTVQTAINFQGTLSSWWTKIFVGVLLLLFIVAQQLFGRVRKSR